MILRLGVYNMSTQRIIRFSEEEIEAGIRGMKRELVMGGQGCSYPEGQRH